MSEHKRRDFKESEFKKVVGITVEDLDYIDQIRGRKSKAGMLREIINHYKLCGLVINNVRDVSQRT